MNLHGFSGKFKPPLSKLCMNRDTMTKSVLLLGSTINTTYVAGTTWEIHRSTLEDSKIRNSH